MFASKKSERSDMSFRRNNNNNQQQGQQQLVLRFLLSHQPDDIL